ncbi:hypothetical protein T03_8601 [Trichinella britovi]|uniref:Uncharacterized protein n=1 Tax=Trichinella britovi TaxID=45882 RepID=A0A0V1D9M3_TRIBR|nr:hypothetical protein T03_8601 [Trichinella britovi]
MAIVVNQTQLVYQSGQFSRFQIWVHFRLTIKHWSVIGKLVWHCRKPVSFPTQRIVGNSTGRSEFFNNLHSNWPFAQLGRKYTPFDSLGNAVQPASQIRLAGSRQPMHVHIPVDRWNGDQTIFIESITTTTLAEIRRLIFATTSTECDHQSRRFQQYLEMFLDAATVLVDVKLRIRMQHCPGFIPNFTSKKCRRIKQHLALFENHFRLFTTITTNSILVPLTGGHCFLLKKFPLNNTNQPTLLCWKWF